MRRFAKRQLCRLLDKHVPGPMLARAPITVYAVIVTVFASNIGDAGFAAQVPLVLVAFALGWGPQAAERGRLWIARSLARRALKAISADTQLQLSFRRRASSVMELREWLVKRQLAPDSRAVAEAVAQLEAEVAKGRMTAG